MISRSATSHGRLVIVAVTVPVTDFEGRIVRPVNEANIAITSWIDALSQLMPVIRGSCDCLAGAVDLLSDTGIIAGAGSVFSTCLLYTSDAADERSSVDFGG